MAKGRMAKSGKRTKSGRLKRDSYAPPLFIKGSEWVQSMVDRYGQDYNTALGRAYAAGLLGDGDKAKMRYDIGKKLARLYKRTIGGDSYTCPLDDSPRGGLVDIWEDDGSQQRWLFQALDTIDDMGFRPFVDQLITSIHTDSGPHWLDRLLSGNKHPVNLARLQAAIQALDAIAPEQSRPSIRVTIS